MAPKEKSLILIKEFVLGVGFDAEIFTSDVNLEEANPGLDKCPKMEAMQKYLHEQSAINKDDETCTTVFMFCDVSDNDQLGFCLNMNIMKYLRDLLLDPFLQIRVVQGGANNEDGDPKNAAHLLASEKRFPLKDMAYPEQDQYSEEQCLHDIRIPYKNDFPSGTSFLCEIKLGWKEPSRKTKMCTQSLMQNLYEDDSSKDLIVVVGNGAEIKCHKFIFTAQIPAFSAMVSDKTGMREARSKKVKLKGHSEEGIRELVRYLYGLELAIGDMESDTALELFQIAHQYGLNQLEDSMLELFLEEDGEWFTADVVLETYFYVRNLKMFEKLMVHSLFLMAGMPTEELITCETFGKLDRAEQVGVLRKLVTYNPENFDLHNILKRLQVHLEDGRRKRQKVSN